MILSNIEEATQMQYCENMLVNVILNYKKQNMNTKTRFETKINIPKEISIEKGDLGVILGNLLDNSVEACNNHVEREKPYIYVNIAMEANMFIICVENSISTVNKELCKKDLVNHGRGLKNVRRLVEKYNGTMEIEKCENSFKVEIMLLL